MPSKKKTAPKKADPRYGPDKGVYTLIGIDREMWKRFKERAESKGHSLRWLILDFAQRYADGA